MGAVIFYLMSFFVSAFMILKQWRNEKQIFVCELIFQNPKIRCFTNEHILIFLI